MALIIVIVIMIIGIAIIGSIYSSVTPFITSLENTVNYNVAYYNAVMGAERGMLALRYHQAGFGGQNGLVSGIKTGNVTDTIESSAKLGRIFKQNASVDSYWKISSLVSTIPAAGQGNVEPLYADTTSSDYNMLNYGETINIPLFKDTTSSPSNYYTTATISALTNGAINFQGRFRLPPRVASLFKSSVATANNFDILANGNTREENDIDDDLIYNDVILGRGIQGYKGAERFKIFPRILVDINERKELYLYDNAIRESIINRGATADNIQIHHNGYTFVVSDEGGNGNSITSNNALPLNSEISGTQISDLFTLSDVSGAVLSFALTNLMKNENDNIFPFLERKFAIKDGLNGTNNLLIPDRFFTLEAVGSAYNATVRFVIKKATNKSSNTTNFTTIF